MTVIFYDTIEGPNITMKKCSSLHDTYILIENLLLNVPNDIFGIAQIASAVFYEIPTMK